MLTLILMALTAKTQYLATYFVGNGEEGAFLAASEDGYRFQPLLEPNVAILKPEIGKDRLMRDPCLLRGPDGWHMVWTTGWWDRSIGVAHSKDLVRWGEQSAIPVMEGNVHALNAWAPEVAYDEREASYVLVWSSTVRGEFSETSRVAGDLAPDGTPLNHRFYTTSTKDFRHYSPTKLLWDPGFNCIDATLLQDGRRWLLFGKDETKAPQPAKYLFAAAGPRPGGPFVTVRERLTGDYWAEGPTAIKVGDTFRVFFDRYMDGRWGAVESPDLLKWTDVSEKIQMPRGARHGTVLPVSADTVNRVRGMLRARH